MHSVFCIHIHAMYTHSVFSSRQALVHALLKPTECQIETWPIKIGV